MARAFSDGSEIIAKNFQKNVIWIEHIGSTAVPGLCAKPIVDILIGVRTCHIHIFQMGHSDIARHINFKYYLIDHPIQAKEYGRLKKLLAVQFPNDIEQYMLHKEDFVQRLEQKAESPIYLSKQVLETERLALRPWKEEDTTQVQYLFHDKSIANRMLHIPYPCDEEQAGKWVRLHQEDSRKGKVSSIVIV